MRSAASVEARLRRKDAAACNRASRVTYTPQDQLFLWLLTRPEQPLLIGELNTVAHSRGVSLRYAEWLARGFALSEDLPLLDEEFLPREKDSAAGAVDDARPDRWGERVIRLSTSRRACR